MIIKRQADLPFHPYITTEPSRANIEQGQYEDEKIVRAYPENLEKGQPVTLRKKTTMALGGVAADWLLSFHSVHTEKDRLIVLLNEVDEYGVTDENKMCGCTFTEEALMFTIVKKRRFLRKKEVRLETGYLVSAACDDDIEPVDTFENEPVLVR